MKNNFFFSAISIAMIFAFIFASSSCQKECLTCGYKTTPPPKQAVVVVSPQPPVKLQMFETIIVGGARFTGWVFCYYLSYGPYVDVRDKDGNDKHEIRCNDEAILKKLDVNCGWDYNQGPAGIGGNGNAIVVMYEDGKLAKVDGYPKYIESTFLVTHFYGKTLGKSGFDRYSELPYSYFDQFDYNSLPEKFKFDLDLGNLKYKDTIEFKVDTANAVIHKLDLTK
ncbi:MAG: hypothetical protein KBD48_02335 [Candidatus Pacebacteria bacterium]|nr:hypothetical protein [Candidatus Paceibacterota bacterium]MBP9716005.1 hypothetical protein [Candidatus Paceibacterota bacterium]